MRLAWTKSDVGKLVVAYECQEFTLRNFGQPECLWILFLFLMKYSSIKHFESMIDLFLVYCHVKHYFEMDEVKTLFDHAARSVILNQFE